MGDETDTQRFRKARNAAGPTVSGLSAAAIVFIYATFTPQDDFRRHSDDEAAKRSRVWQRVMDHELEIDRLKRRFATVDGTNVHVVVSEP